MYKFFRLFKRKYDWKAILSCISAATLFWFLNAMNSDHVADVNYPVVFTYNEQELMFTSEKSQVLRFHVSGSGWEIFKMKLGWWDDPIQFDVVSKRSYKYFLTKDLSAIVEDKLADVVDVRYFLDDTLYTGLDKVQKVKFKVVLSRETIGLKKGYKLDGPIQVSPEYILVTGPVAILDTISKKVVIACSESDISEDYKEEIALPALPHPLLKANEEKIEVSFKVSNNKRPFSE